MCLHQPINTSTEAEPSHTIATSSQANEGAPCQPLPQEEEPDHVQIDDWEDKAKEEAAVVEEEEQARVQLEIKRLRQEQNIKRERARFSEMQYNLDILRQQEREAPLQNQIRNQPPPPPPSPPHNQITHQLYQPPPPQNHLFQPPFPP
jgi:hypothetical protein